MSSSLARPRSPHRLDPPATPAPSSRRRHCLPWASTGPPRKNRSGSPSPASRPIRHLYRALAAIATTSPKSDNSHRKSRKPMRLETACSRHIRPSRNLSPHASAGSARRSSLPPTDPTSSTTMTPPSGSELARTWSGSLALLGTPPAISSSTKPSTAPAHATASRPTSRPHPSTRRPRPVHGAHRHLVVAPLALDRPRLPSPGLVDDPPRTPDRRTRRRTALQACQQVVEASTWNAPHESSIGKDISAFIRTYGDPTSRTWKFDDQFGCPLRDLAYSTASRQAATDSRRNAPPRSRGRSCSLALLDYAAMHPDPARHNLTRSSCRPTRARPAALPTQRRGHRDLIEPIVNETDGLSLTSPRAPRNSAGRRALTRSPRTVIADLRPRRRRPPTNHRPRRTCCIRTTTSPTQHHGRRTKHPVS